MIITDERVARFVGDKLNTAFVPPWTAMGIARNDKVMAGVIFNVFEGADVHVSVAGRGFTKCFLAEVGRYVFDQLKCERMTIQTEHPSVVSIAERLGGKVEGLKRNHFGVGRDAYLVGILKSEWKF